jgi:hypothetical protein
MVIVPHPPYLPDLTPSFRFASQIETQTEGNCKQCLTALRKITSTVLLKRGKNGGIAVYVPKETILKEMAAKIE